MNLFELFMYCSYRGPEFSSQHSRGPSAVFCPLRYRHTMRKHIHTQTKNKSKCLSNYNSIKAFLHYILKYSKANYGILKQFKYSIWPQSCSFNSYFQWIILMFIFSNIIFINCDLTEILRMNVQWSIPLKRAKLGSRTFAY